MHPDSIHIVRDVIYKLEQFLMVPTPSKLHEAHQLLSTTLHSASSSYNMYNTNILSDSPTTPCSYSSLSASRNNSSTSLNSMCDQLENSIYLQTLEDSEPATAFCAEDICLKHIN